VEAAQDVPDGRRGTVEAGLPQPAARAERVPHGGATEARRRLGLPRLHCIVRARTTPGARVQHPTDAPNSVDVRLNLRCPVSAGLSHDAFAKSVSNQ
jgi:hypothetical protein